MTLGDGEPAGVSIKSTCWRKNTITIKIVFIIITVLKMNSSTGRLDNSGSCLKLSIAEEPSPCSAEQLLFSPLSSILSSISWRFFYHLHKAIVNHLQQLGTSVWSHRSPCGLRKNQFWTRYVSCFTILPATTISDNTNPVTSLWCL